VPSGLDIGMLLFWLVAAVAALLSGALTDWRRYAAGGRGDLPLWRFLARRRIGRAELAGRWGEARVEIAEARCTFCDSQALCAKLLRSGEPSPPVDCPNAALFSAIAS
jgi:hypothetical protein